MNLRIPGKKSVASARLPAEISHYTTLEGFRCIVQNRCLWASNASFLNDRAELEHALQVSEKVITKLSSQKALKSWSAMIKRVFKELAEGARPDTYVACFCEDDDNLSQWRGYSGAEQGVSITFNRKKLADRLSSEKANFFKVSYSKFSTATKVHDALKAELSEIADLDEAVGSLPAEQRYRDLRSRVSALLPRFKHLGFKDEREWRFAIQRIVEGSALQFRVATNKIVPYIVIGSDDEPLPITSVRIGPGVDQELTSRSVQLFLKTLGHDVPVNVSEVPFRQ